MCEAEQDRSGDERTRKKLAERHRQKILAREKAINKGAIESFFEGRHHERRANDAADDKEDCEGRVETKHGVWIPWFMVRSFRRAKIDHSDSIKNRTQINAVNGVQRRIMSLQSNPHHENANTHDDSRPRETPLEFRDVTKKHRQHGRAGQGLAAVDPVSSRLAEAVLQKRECEKKRERNDADESRRLKDF